MVMRQGADYRLTVSVRQGGCTTGTSPLYNRIDTINPQPLDIEPGERSIRFAMEVVQQGRRLYTTA